MKRKFKILSLIMAIFMGLMPVSLATSQNKIVGLDNNVKAYLIANEETGEVYYEKNADESMPMASLSKLMTFLLVEEAIDEGKISLDTKVEADSESEKLTSWEYSALSLIHI